MEKKSMYVSVEALAVELARKASILMDEANYLKFQSAAANELTIMNSIGIAQTRIADVTDTMRKLLKIEIEIVKESQVPRETLMCIKRQIDESNSRIIQYSNQLTNSGFFTKSALYL